MTVLRSWLLNKTPENLRAWIQYPGSFAVVAEADGAVSGFGLLSSTGTVALCYLWCDVILRLRSVIDTITREYRRERVLIVGHQVTVSCFRYLFERLDEKQILEIDRNADIPNCSVTSYEFDPTRGKNGKLVPKLISFVAPLLEAGAPVTAEPDLPAAPKS